ncbi:MAG: hypothetical protein ACK5KO_12245 [Arachnia sp.]
MRRLDVPSLVVALATIGAAVICLASLLGYELLGNIKIWFAVILIGAGLIGLLVSLAYRNIDRR